ncbi:MULTISPECIES: M16 family metallopeptidase [Candidatus Ichthyocystis]|uniref:Putative peptidase, M16 family n=1 Tax=Candidatus Ichthyocystis hellenicum TaxID=1561003 RepID=A0A0S4M2Y9_9BURK|nr:MULTISPECIES: pitrilysin family protein [Ichthyocystis]CUT17098.1 putative peptidase, M16 family [Candidatus Ichthyocystis hellenicum]
MGRVVRCFIMSMFTVVSFLANSVPLTVQHWYVDNVPVLFVETKRSPILDISLSFAAGSAYDPQGYSGLASLVASLLSMGSAEKDEFQIADKFSALGASYSATVDADRSVIHLRTLSDSAAIDDALRVVISFITNPSFLPDVVERQKRLMISHLKTEKSFPSFYVKRSLYRQVYSGHPYGVMPTESSIASISAADIKHFYDQHYNKRSLSIAIVGHVSRETSDSIVSRLLSGLHAGTRKYSLPRVRVLRGHVEKTNFLSRQTHIAMGVVAVSYDDPDYFPLLVANQAFGGDQISSRLALNIRQRKGLAYSVRTYFLPQQKKGLFGISLQTRDNRAGDAISAVKEELNRLVKDCFTDVEVSEAKERLIKDFSLRQDTSLGYLHILSLMGFYRLSPSWIDSYGAHVNSVTRDSVCKAVRSHIKLRFLSTAIVGPVNDKNSPIDSNMIKSLGH